MASAFPSEATVALTPLQQWTTVDASDMATIPQATTDNVVAAFLAAGQAYSGLAVTANQDAKGVTVGTGILYNLGGGYPLRAPFNIDLTPQINAIPDAVQSQIVLIVANGGTATVQESRTLEDASLKPSNPADLWPTVQQVVTTRNVRAVTPSIVPGTPAASNVQPPAFNPLLCLLATVTLNKTGVISVAQSTAAQIVGLDKLAPLVAAQGTQLAAYQAIVAGLLSSVSSLAMAISQIKRDFAAQIAALQASITALSAQQVTASTTGTSTVVTIVDTFTDTSGLTVAASPSAAVGSGLTFPQGTTNPVSYFPLAAYASNLKVLANRWLTAPYAEVFDGGNPVNGDYTRGPNWSGGSYTIGGLGPWNVTPQLEGFAVQRTRFGAGFGAQSAAAILAGSNPSQLFGSASYALAYDAAWQAWPNFAPEISHQNGLWRDLAARGFWGPRSAGLPTGNLPAISQVFQTDTDDMVTRFKVYKRLPGFNQGSGAQDLPSRLLVCEELNGAPDPNNVLLDVTGKEGAGAGPNGVNYPFDEFVFNYPLLRKAGRRYHFVVVYNDADAIHQLTTRQFNPDPSLKTFLVRNGNGGWSQDSADGVMSCAYGRASFTASTPIELNTVTLNGGIDNLDVLTPAIVPTGCEIYYGTIGANGAYTRLGQIDPNNPATNPLAGRPSLVRLAVEIVPTGRTAPIIDMVPTAIGTTTATPARRAGTLAAQSAVRSPVDATGKAVAVTKVSQTVTLQGFNPASPVSHTFAVQLGTGANYATLTAPTSSSGPTAQSDGTVQFTFSWTLGAGVTSFVTIYSGTTQDVTQTFTIAKAITTAAP